MCDPKAGAGCETRQVSCHIKEIKASLIFGKYFTDYWESCLDMGDCICLCYTTGQDDHHHYLKWFRTLFLLTLLPCVIVHNLSVKNCQWSFHQCWKYIFLQIFVLKRSLYKYCFKFVRLPSLLHFTFVFVMEVFLYLSLSSRNFHICADLQTLFLVLVNSIEQWEYRSHRNFNF